MTLSPVFRSEEALEALRAAGVWDRLTAAGCAQKVVVDRIRADLLHVLDDRYVGEGAAPVLPEPESVPVGFVQEFFFLIFFRSVLESAGLRREALDLYSEVNFCVKGAITAADNLFDDQQKSFLPLRRVPGARFRSILELLAFERLLERTLDRAERSALVSRASGSEIRRELLSRMAAIGTLEGREERGIEEILDVETMVERVHRVRGGALFELALVTPRHVEPPAQEAVLSRIGEAFAGLGTAFQIVDDLTDFEFDLLRGRQNLLVAQVHHRGSPAERATLARIRKCGVAPPAAVEISLRESARAVLERATAETRASLNALQAVGFWFTPSLADQLVRAIVGLDGVALMKAL